MQVVRKYGQASCQCINFDKSSLLFGKKIPVNDRQLIKDTVGVRLVTILKIRGTNRKRTLKNKIAGIKRNGCSIPYLTRNNFVRYFSTKKKRMVGNEKVKLFLMNGDLF